METILNNTACFLNEGKWPELIKRAILRDETFDTHQDLMSMLWSALTIAPRLFRDTTRIVVADQLISQVDIEAVIEELVIARSNLIQWQILAEKKATMSCIGLEWCGDGVAVRWPSFTNTKCDSVFKVQLAMYGTYAMCRIFKARLLYSLDPARFQYLEDESQALAKRVMEMEHQSNNEKNRNIWSLFMSQSTWIAKSIIETKITWKIETHCGKGTIGRSKFEAWCSAIGRRID